MTDKCPPRFAIPILIACIVIILFGGTGRKQEGDAHFSTGQVQLSSPTAPRILQVEVASTAANRARGLMFRKSWGTTQGMLFLFPSAEQVSMWMKDTPLPLDMVFLAIDKENTYLVRHIIENTTPYSTDNISSLSPVSAVLELPAGSVRSYGVKVGDNITFTATDHDAQ